MPKDDYVVDYVDDGWVEDWVKSTRLLPITPGQKRFQRNRSRWNVSLGWQPDLPDLRDRTLDHPAITEGLKNAKSSLASNTEPQPSVDLRANCSPVEDQGDLGSCTAQAVVGMMEYMMRRATGGEHVDGSRLFLYKVTRRLAGLAGDTGAYLRTTMKAVAAFGIPPERYWPYDITQFEEEPSAFLYSFASNYKALNYARLDPRTTTPLDVLSNVKRVINAKFPVVFGFTTYSSLGWDADIPFPLQTDSATGGHAVLAVGYDDNHELAGGVKEPSLLIRNSWGRQWGDDGYGWLPYRYIEEGLATDFWATFKTEWLESEQFN